MKVSDLIARMLQEYGVTHVFFVPQIFPETLVELERSTTIDRVLTHGEKAAAYMADGYARASGRPGVCLAQNVGAANLAAGLRDGWLANSPILAITGGPWPWSRGLKQYQEAVDLPIFAPLTKYSTHVDSPDRLPDTIRQAFRAATSGRPGPVHLEVEGHHGEIEALFTETEPLVEPRYARVPAFRPVPEHQDVVEVLRVLAGAARPVIVAGGGVCASRARDELRALAELLAIPVATSATGKDAFPGDHPLSVGVVGRYSRQSANDVVGEADVVFYVGCPAGSLATHSFQIPPPGTTTVQLDIDPIQLGRNCWPVATMLADAKAGLSALLAAATSNGDDRKDWLTRVRTIVRGWREQFRPLFLSNAEPLRPERLCAEVQAALPNDGILVADTGHSSMWTTGMIDLEATQRYLRSAGSLGWGLPGAMGAKCGAPERPVVLFTGDGGLWYHVGEIETAVRKSMGIVVVVNNNRSLNQELRSVERVYGGSLQGNHADLWYHEDVDFARVAEAMGATALRVTNADELGDALRTAVVHAETESAPVVVDVVTDINVVAPIAVVR